MPTPNKKESEKDFIQRCMSHDETVKKYPDEKQRYAVCKSLFSQAKASTWIKDLTGEKDDN